MKVDLNCDLGEGEPPARTRSLMRWVTSVNVACGGHAGDAASMSCCVRLARELRVRLGAHPGAWDREGFGRTEIDLAPDQFELLLLQQVGALERVARRFKVRLSHVKLHGALYHAVEERADLRRRYLACMARWWPGMRIYALAGGNVVRAARRQGVPVWEEAFVDREYDDAGQLASRSESAAVITDTAAVTRRIREWIATRQVVTVGGKLVRVNARTWCIHADKDSAVALARAARRVFDARR